MAEDFIMAFEGRLWTKSGDHSLYPLIDTTSMEAAGALLESAFKRFLCLADQLTLYLPSPKGETSKMNGEACFIVEKAKKTTKSHGEGGSMRCPSSTQMAQAEVKPCATMEPPVTTSTNWPAEKELGSDLPLDPKTSKNNMLSKTETCHLSSDPQRSEDGLRRMGSVVGSFWNKDLHLWGDHKALAEWICRLSLAANEESVSLKHALLFAC
jgi:hypothetical protein